MNANPTATPSVTPPAAPVPAAATPPAAPSAPATEPKTLADYQELALKSMTEEPPQPAPVPAAAQEPPVAVPPAPASDLEVPVPPPEPIAEIDGDEPEVPAEEQAQWTEGEKRLYGALKKERAARKEAKSELKGLRDEVAELKKKVEPKAPEVAPVAAAPAIVSGQPLAHCTSFEAVDKEVVEANRVELLTYDLQTRLGRNERPDVVAALAAEGVKEIDGVPIADASDRAIGDFLSATFKGARLTQNQATPRKQWLLAEDQSAAAAMEKMPALRDGKSAESQRFQQIIRENPQFKLAGPNWPVVVMTYLRGELADGRTPVQTPKATVTPPKPEIVPPKVTRQTPGAPRATGAALPQSTELDAARDRVAKGTASMADVNMLAKQGLNAGSPALTRV